MRRCLSDKSLVECYSGDGTPADLIHLEDCRSCAARYRALESDLTLITQTLAAPPPQRRTARGLGRWRVAVSAAAVAAAFAVGWSLRGVSLSQFSSAPQIAHTTASKPIQLSSARPQAIEVAGSTSAMYAAYVQDAFGSDPCSEANDPLAPGCL
jgi:hypothetical protein